jgi:hypothetical protein
MGIPEPPKNWAFSSFRLNSPLTPLYSVNHSQPYPQILWTTSGIE